MCLTKKLEWTKQSKQSLNWIRLVQRRPPPSSNMCIRAFVRWTSCGCGWFEWEKWNAQWLRSGFGNRQLVNFSDCVWGFGRLRKKKFLPWKGHLLSLLYAKGCRLHECRECRESAWSNGGGAFSHPAGPDATVGCCHVCSSTQVGQTMNTFDTWYMHVQCWNPKPLEEALNWSEVAGGYARVVAMICGRFPSKNNSRNTTWFWVVFLHENKSRRQKNTPGTIVAARYARNYRLRVPIILGPVNCL
jgi:hypothetical protein